MIARSPTRAFAAGSSLVDGLGGGVLADYASVTLDDSTMSGNNAVGTGGAGGAIWQSGSRLGLRYSTVSANTATVGGGFYLTGEGGTLLGSIVSGNLAKAKGVESDCVAGSAAETLSSVGGNVLGQAACVAATQSSDSVSTKPGLGKLANYG